MPFPDLTAGGLHAFLAGIITSPHCVGMCGPLFCAMIPLRNENRPSSGISIEGSQIAYHSGRVISYCLLGWLAGSLSLRLIEWFKWDFSVYFPWILIGFLLIFALGMDRWLPKGIPGFSRRLSGMMKLLRKLPSWIPFFGVGLFSPLLPCAPLYMVLWVALVSGSPLFGMQIMLGFSLGTIPLLWLAQSQFLKYRAKWASRYVRWVQRGLAAVAALILAIRFLMIGGPLEGGACIGG